MPYQLEKSTGLNNTQLSQISRLEEACNKFDNLTMKLNWATLRSRPTDAVNDFLYYENDSLVGHLALYSFNNREAEVSAMTHPKFRRQGIFRRLLAAANTELNKRGVSDFLFICEQASQSGAGCMTAIEANYDFSEYKMELQEAVTAVSNPALTLRPAQQDDLMAMSRLDVICFNVPDDAAQTHPEKILAEPNRQGWIATLETQTIGKIQVTFTGAETYISGFCLFPEYRGQGYGTSILTHTVQQLVSQGHANITLEVATENKGALSLYERCGFQVSTAYDYYRLPVNA